VITVSDGGLRKSLRGRRKSRTSNSHGFTDHLFCHLLTIPGNPLVKVCVVAGKSEPCGLALTVYRPAIDRQWTNIFETTLKAVRGETVWV